MQARAHRQHEAARQGRARAQELALSTRERIARSQARLARTYALLAPPVDPPPAP